MISTTDKSYKISDYGIANDIDATIKRYLSVAVEQKRNIPNFLSRIIETQNKRSMILDIGCGVGTHLQILYEKGFENVHGLDIIREPLVFAKSGGLKNILQANCELLPYKSDSFDYCIAHNVIEHILRPKQLLQEIRRVLKPGSMVHITAPNAYSLDDRVLRLGGLILHGRSSHIQKFNFSKLNLMFENSGLKIEGAYEGRGLDLDYPLLEKIPFFKAIRYCVGRCLKNQVQRWAFELQRPASTEHREVVNN